MELYFAPLEGVTDFTFRMTHRKYYGGPDRYYIPFLTPTQTHVLAPKERREVLPAHNLDTHAVPQLLTKSSEDFNWAAQVLKDLGYGMVNLNLGCPSGTVVPKGKGSGFLADPDRLDAFLEEVFTAGVLPVSVKTRLGLRNPEEFDEILEIYAKYPLAELIIHPRTREEMYQGPLHPEYYEKAVTALSCPVCYNGDIRTADQIRALADRQTPPAAVMIGRGLIADPGLALRWQGKKPAAETFGAFCDELSLAYLERFGSQKNTLMRMKHLWSYWLEDHPQGEKLWKKMRKCNDWPTFYAMGRQILAEGDWHP